MQAEKRLPDTLIACVGGGSNAIGLFHAFIARYVREDDRRGSGWPRQNLSANMRRVWRQPSGFSGARPGVLQGTYTYVLQTTDGQIATTHSVSAGLDYPGVGPEHAWLAEQGRAEYMRGERRGSRGGRAHARAHGRNYSRAGIRARAGGIDSPRTAHEKRRTRDRESFRPRR